MKKIVWFSDIHLGLKTSEIDRTEEIVKVSLQSVKRACELKKQGFDVRLVIGGDVFQHNDPSDYLIAQFIRIINPAVVIGIPIDILVGNHDSIANPEKKSCLESFKKMKGAYKCVKVVDDIKSKKWFTADYGHVYLTYFPHITKAHIDGKEYESTQEYINQKAERIFNKIGPGQNQIVFSHLNVRGLIPGSEENLLKKSEAWFPEIYLGEEHSAFNGSLPPLILQGHIHTRQKHQNMHVVGAPLFCDFGEKEKKKYFVEVDVPETLQEKFKVHYIKTQCLKFVELEFDFTGGKQVKMNPKKYKEEIKGAIVKLNVTIDANSAQQDWQKVRQDFQKLAHYVKPIVPTYIKDRVTRNEEQSLKLSPLDASRVWLKRHKPKGWKRKLELAKDYIEKTL